VRIDVTKSKYLLDVSLCLKGEALDPVGLSKLLGVTATTARRKGEKRTIASNKEVTSKGGVWILRVQKDLDVLDLSSVVEELVAKIGNKTASLVGIPGVEHAYVDVFVATKSRDDGGGTCEFELSALNIASVRELGLPVQFTVAVVKP
jgi:hypothetical protein